MSGRDSQILKALIARIERVVKEEPEEDDIKRMLDEAFASLLGEE